MSLKLLDTTLRDGSYIVNFQWSSEDTSRIASRLDQCGIHMIEIGHGLGMGAYRIPKYESAADDISHMTAARKVVKTAELGVFIIPGIGKLSDIDLAVAYGMDFVRIGTNANELDSMGFIEYAKSKKIKVFSNLMKTYSMSPLEVSKRILTDVRAGSDGIFIVDSAGGMLPEDLKLYTDRIRTETEIALGFHGHNNLGLAVANALKAADLGFSIVDTSLRGLGRDAGNAATEMVSYALMKRGFKLEIDVLGLMDISESFIDNLYQKRISNKSLSVVSGFAQFHSSFTEKALEVAQEFNIDPRKLIIETSGIDKIEVTYDTLRLAALRVERKTRNMKSAYISTVPHISEKRDSQFEIKAAEIATRIKQVALKMGHTPVFNILQPIRVGTESFVSKIIYDGPEYTIGSAEIISINDFEILFLAVEGFVEYVLLDIDSNKELTELLLTSSLLQLYSDKILLYSDNEVLARSILRLLIEKLGIEITKARVGVIGHNPLARAFHSVIEHYGKAVSQIGLAEFNFTQVCSNDFEILVFCEVVNKTDFQDFNPNPIIKPLLVDAIIGALPVNLVETLLSADILVYRPDMRIHLHSEVSSIVSSREFVSSIQGIASYGEMGIAAGGIVAKRGTIIVDRVKSPTTIFGIADGFGFLIDTNKISDAEWTSLEHMENILKNDSEDFK